MNVEIFSFLLSMGISMFVGAVIGWLWCGAVADKIRCPKCYFTWRPESVLIEITDREEPPVLTKSSQER